MHPELAPRSFQAASSLRSSRIPCVTAVWISLGVLVLGTVWLYNRLVHLRNKTRDAFGGIDAQLKRRHDLVPNIVATVKAYAAHEREALEAVTEARAGAQAATALPAVGLAETGLGQAIGGLLGLVERYPELKADASFRKLHDELVEVEDAIQYARRYYNGAVRDYNTACEQFPTNLVAGVFGFEPREFFELEENQR